MLYKHNLKRLWLFNFILHSTQSYSSLLVLETVLLEFTHIYSETAISSRILALFHMSKKRVWRIPSQTHSIWWKCGTTTVWKRPDAIIRLLVLLSVYTALFLSALAGQRNDQPVMQDGNACTTFLTELFWSSIQQVLGRAVENRSEQDAGSTFLCFQTDRAKTDDVVCVF